MMGPPCSPQQSERSDVGYDTVPVSYIGADRLFSKQLVAIAPKRLVPSRNAGVA